MEENEHEEGDFDFVKSLLQTKEVLLEGRDILGSETEEPRNYKTISCECCKKKNKTKAGYDRHIRNVHSSKSSVAQISDNTITDIFQTALSELGADLCYPETIRSKWKIYQIKESKNLYDIVKKIYEKLLREGLEALYKSIQIGLRTRKVFKTSHVVNIPVHVYISGWLSMYMYNVNIS